MSVSSFGASLDIITDNLSRGIIWTHLYGVFLNNRIKNYDLFKIQYF